MLKDFKMIREKLYSVISGNSVTLLGKMYSLIMIVAIVISLLPLAFKTQSNFMIVSDEITVSFFVIDYFLRWITADFKYSEHSVFSFVRYPFSAMAIIDLLSILPSVTFLTSALKILRITRLARALKILRVVRFARYSRSIAILTRVMQRSKSSLFVVGGLAIVYILVSALIIFNIEPQSFSTYFDAIYWSTVSLTTVGYGDLYPVTTTGRIIAMLSSFFGIAIVALPAGIITAEYVEEIKVLK